PDLYRTQDKPKPKRGEVAWEPALDGSGCNLEKPPPQLAVGLRARHYERVMIGRVQADEHAATNGMTTLKLGSGSEKVLYPFFKSDAPAESVERGSVPEENEPEVRPDDPEGRSEEAHSSTGRAARPRQETLAPGPPAPLAAPRRNLHAGRVRVRAMSVNIVARPPHSPPC